MYYIVNKTTDETILVEGNFPINLVDSLLNNGNDIIIISTYSDTIKIPTTKDFGETWEWKEFGFPPHAMMHYHTQPPLSGLELLKIFSDEEDFPF